MLYCCKTVACRLIQTLAVLSIVVAGVWHETVTAQDAPTKPNAPSFAISIWPDLAPDETTKQLGTTLPPRNPAEAITRVEQITSPSMAVLEPATPCGTAVVILPGGGFSYTVPDLEGTDAAPFLNELGITVFVLNYRVSGDKSDDAWRKPVQDSQRAVRWVRANAARYGLDPKRIGVLGFSAGGQAAAAHLTATDAFYLPIDEIDDQPFSPNFGMLIYPWQIEAEDGKLRPMIQVSKRTPPMFIVSTHDDTGALSTGAAKLYIDLKENRVSAELHVYRSGGHGYGTTSRKDSVIHKWPDAATDWLKLEVLR